MLLDLSRLKTHAASAAIVGALLVAVLGVTAFFLALRPSHLHFEPGQLVTYRLHTELAELVEVAGVKEARELPASVQDQMLNLICVGADNDVVLLAPVNGRDEVTLLNFASDGTARCLDAAARPGEAGKALGFFDFNLLPLPPGSEQAWNVELVYAALPPAKHNVQGKVRRTRSGANPEFQLKLPTSVEWVNASSRYQQIRDLVCTYRFNGTQRLIDQASVRCLAGIEGDDGGRRRYRLRADLTLVGVGRVSDDPRQVRDLALAGAEAQEALAGGRRERLATLSARILAADVQNPRLRELAKQLVYAVRSPAPPTPPAARPLWAVQLASGPADHRPEAEAFVRQLAAGGFRAYLAARGDTLAVLVGPYYDRDPAVLGALSQRYPQQRAAWIAVGP